MCPSSSRDVGIVLRAPIMAIGAFLFAIGGSMIAADAQLVPVLKLGLSGLSDETSLALVGMLLAAVGAALLAFGVAAQPKMGGGASPQ